MKQDVPASARSLILTDRTAWVLVGLVLLAGTIRVVLADYSLWYDEYASLYFAHQPLRHLWSDWMIRETNPPLFYTMLKGWLAMGFESRPAVRLLPIAGGTLQVALLGLIGWRWLGREAAIAVAILATLAPAGIYFSHLVRAYIFATDAVLVSLIGLLLALEPGAGRRVWPWMLYGIGCTAAIYLHTTMFIWPLAVTVALGLCRVAGFEQFGYPFVRRFVVANLVVLALSAWWLQVSYSQMHSGLNNLAWNAPVGPREFGRRVLGAIFLTIEPYDRDKVVTTLLPVLTVAILVWRRHDARVRLLGVLFGVTLLTFGVLGALAPIVIQRTLYWMTIFPLLIVAAGLGQIRRPAWRHAALAVLGLLLLNNLRVHYHEYEAQDWEQALRVLSADPAGLVLVQGAGMGMNLAEACRMQFGQARCPFRVVTLGETVHDPVRSPAAWAQAVTALRRSLRPGDRVYALRSYDYDPFAALAVPAGALPAGWHDRFLQGPLPAKVLLAQPLR